MSHGVPRFGLTKDSAKEEQKIADYRALVSTVSGRVANGDLSAELLALVSQLLTKNPEYYTVWNYRRRILQAHIANTPAEAEELISSDLAFLVPLLLQFPKCYWIWNYRLWLLDVAEESLEPAQAKRKWQEELGLVGKMLSRDERNFHGWDYRRHVVAQLDRLMAPTGHSMVEAEFEYTTQMIRKALQNFSALHYRSKLIPRLLLERDADGKQRREMLETELDLMQEALIDPYNQSAWFYHQFLMSNLILDAPETECFVLDLTDEDRKEYFQQEIERITEMLEDFDDCKWIYVALIQYTTELRALDPNAVSASDLPAWVAELSRLDPTRSGRWRRLEQTIKN